MDIVSPLVQPIVDCIIKRLTRRVSYVFNYRRNVAELRDKVQTLAGARENLQKSVEAAGREGDEIQKNVEKWLADADKAIVEAEKLVQGEEHANKKRCFAGLCPDLKGRYQLGKKAAEEAIAIARLKDEGNFDRISYLPALQQIVTTTANCLEGLPSRESILKEVIDALKDPNVNMVGLYGLGGTGKTTLASEVHRQAIEAKLFDLVVMATVSENPQLEKIQGKIADVMGMKLGEETVEGRASRLRQRLKEKEKEKEKEILVILDNLWAEIDLKEIGIPSGDEHKGCKMLLTSRSQDVLSKMGTQKFLRLEPLSEDEAWKLFQKTVGDSNTQIMPSLAIEVASKCVGIPLAIVIMAKALRTKQEYAWRDALTKMSTTSRFDNRRIEMPKELYTALELSFNHLVGEEVKSVFLLFSLYPRPSVRIGDLLKYGVGLGLFEGIDSIKDARNRLLTLIDDLKAACFLLDDGGDGYVKMHDFVLSFAMSIASGDQNATFVKTAFGSKESAERHIPNSCTRLSLLCSDINHRPEDLKCPELDFLLVEGNRSLIIPDSFFSGTRKLKVLDCSRVAFSCLPRSLGLLTSLQTLCLDGCVLPNIAVVGALKKLEILSLYGADVVELPRDIGQLAQLKLLDLTNCRKLEVIPANILSKLLLLEELYMRNSFVNWEVKALDDQSNASLCELEHLSCLTNLEIDIPDAKKLLKGLFFKRLERFKISIGEGWDWDGECPTSRTLKLKLHTNFQSWAIGVKFLLKKAENLYLDEVKGVTNTPYDLHKKVKSSPASASSTHSRENQSTTGPWWPLFNEMIVFPNLEKLKLSSITVENIWWNQPGDHTSFYNLTSLTVEGCRQINYLFTSEMVRNLAQLQRLKIFECDLMERVISAEGETISKTLFPKLESLKLKSLSKLVRFCDGDFMELASLKKLWIKNCSVLKSFISNSITTSEANLALFDEKVAFPNLEELRIKDMNVLKMIWQNELHEGSFCKLKTMIIQQAKELVNVFPSNILMSRFMNLEDLQLTNCELLEEIFDLRPHEELINFSKSHARRASQLKDLRIQNLPNLKHIWKKDAQNGEIVFFHNLHGVHVSDCPSLKSIFPASIAMCLPELKELTIKFCGIEEIIDRGGDTETIFLFEFPKLTTLELYDVKELGTFYPRTHKSNWPMLKKLKVHGCPKMEMFSLESRSIEEKGWSNQSENSSRQPFFTVEKGFPNLEELTLDGKDAKSRLNGNCPDNLFQKVRFLCLQNFDKESASVLFVLLGRFPNLESLHVENRGSRRLDAVTELFSCESLINEENQGRTIPRIKLMKLHSLHKLKRFCRQDCQLDRIFESLETLEVSFCNSLISLGPSISIASFGNLSRLDVWFCEGLLNLVTSSTAQCLGLLTELGIRHCRMVNEVVAREEDDGEDQITWGNLKSLKLCYLESLTYFCSAYHTFNFPSLEEVIIEQCHEMKAFSRGVSITPKLKKVKLTEYSEKERWEGDLNTTIQQLCAELVTFDGISHLKLSEYPQLKEKWHSEELPAKFFSNLWSLSVDECASSLTAIPANLLPFLDELRELEVQNCDLVEEVFDLTLPNAADAPIGTLPKLSNLLLIDLPRLKHVWNEEPKGVFDFRNLEVLKIHNCPTLKYIFSPTTCFGLVRLRELEVKGCPLIEEIISKEVTCNVEFPLLSSIYLECLPNLTSFYPENGTVQCPSVQKIAVFDCSSAFTLTFLSEPSPNATNGQAKVNPNLEELTLRGKAAKSILNSSCPDYRFQKVRLLSLENFDKESASVLFALLERFQKLKRLDVGNNRLTELFSCEGLINEENQGRTIPRIKHMKLEYLYRLKRFCKQDCQLDRIFESLETLEVSFCNSLISLGPSINIASFGNLSRLDVSYCKGLLNLVTSSTAQCLGLLTELCISYCSMVNEVVAGGEDDRKDQITWGNLKSLKLCNLSNLTYFCSAYHTFNFPSLKEVIIKQCPKMKAFSGGVSITPKLEKVKLSERNDKGRWEGDLNTTIQQLYAELVSFDGTSHLKLSEYPQLKEKWHSEELPAKFFSNLSSLIVDECASSPTAIPSNLLPFLDNLWSFEVQKCDLVEEVFDLTLPNAAADAPIGTLPKLYRLELIDLPRLKHVWNEEPKGVFEFRNLKVIKIHNCPRLKYIFTPTTCFGLVQLRELEVKDCPLIEEIISKEATACNVEFFPGQAMELEVKNCTSVEKIITSGEEEVVVNTMFSQLNSLVLESLPNLTSFCSTNVLELQSLEKVTVVNCPRIELFACTILGAQEPNVVVTNEGRLGQEGFSTPAVLLFGAKVACRNLKKLKVECNNNTKGLLNGKFPTEYSTKIEVLELTNFSQEETFFPADILLRLPSLEKLVVNDADFGELFLEQRIVEKKNSDEQVTNLRQLKLSKLPKVSQLFQDHSIPDLVIQNLETLKVIECIGLKILMPSSLSFQNLTILKVSKCHGLTNLMTSSTAKSLEKLTRMSITECDMLEEIVSEGNEGEDEIAFSQLEDLELRCLPNLVGFCSGNHTFNFPLLEEVTLIECSKMKFFSKGTVYSPQLTELQISVDEDQWCWEGSLNQTVQTLFSEMGVGNA